MTELVLRPLADAFMQVGVFVAVLVAPFGWARWRWGGRLDGALLRHARLGPVVGAALTTPPGCGGAIIVMAVYARGCASFGTAVAALVATMGDAAWVLLAAEPVLTLKLKALMLVTGVATGYGVDALGIRPRRRVDSAPAPAHDPAHAPTPVSAGVHPGVDVRSGERVPVAAFASAPARSGDTAAVRSPLLLATRTPTLLHSVGVLPLLFWLLVGTGFTVSLPVTFQLLDTAALATALGGVDLYLTLGVTGTLVAVVSFVRGGCTLADDDLDTAHPSSLAMVFRHGAREVAFVTVWVAVAYLTWQFFTTLTGFDGSQLPLIGLAGVAVGALVGLIPGCGVQIVFAGIFLAGGMPLPTLAANAISQDGDALLPLLALERGSALVATVLTTVPALVVGTALHLLR